jgi:hypothetical protein
MVGTMLITRISRGAARVSLLAQHKLLQYQVKIPTFVVRPTRGLLLTALVARTLFIPGSILAPASAVAAGPDTADPSPRVVRVSVEAQQALHLTRTDEPTLAISTSALSPILVGQSEADAQAAADAIAAAEAAQKAADEAAAKALAAKTAQPVAAANVSSNVPQYSHDEMVAMVYDAADRYGIDGDLLYRIGMCESGLTASSRNRGGSSASGAYQFLLSTWRNTPQGHAGLSVFDGKANIEAAAWKIANGGLSAWNASRHCWGR